MSETIAAAELDRMTLSVLTSSGSLTAVDVGALAGPGVWRRVLAELESRGIEDRDHVLPAWEYGLVGEWHY